MEPTVEVTRYQVSCLPAVHPDAHHFSLSVERRSTNPDSWCVTDGAYCYDLNGNAEYEANPSSRTDKFKRNFRHSLDEALQLAKRIAPTMTINGLTPAKVLARSS